MTVDRTRSLDMSVRRPTMPMIALCFSLVMTTMLAADEPIELVPEPIEFSSTQIDEIWKRWDGIADLEGVITYRERITAIADDKNDLWVGTSRGRLLRHTWQTRQVTTVAGLEDRFRELVKLSDGRLFAASQWSLYEAAAP
jgi:hypothetical protein